MTHDSPMSDPEPDPGEAPQSAEAGWQPPAPEELARLLPQYRIESLIGCGGMAAVYRGAQVDLDRPVAIKLLPAEMAADGQFVGRFRTEARILANLHHPGIVTVYESGQTGEGHLYFVMEFVAGTDLHHLLRDSGLNPQQALALASQVCDALQYAHEHGVIHSDIKPGNILITGGGGAKLADFGLARPAEAAAASAAGSGPAMGTPDYAAPEQHDGLADPRSDLFSLGVVLYEMLTGQLPRGTFDPPSRKAPVDVRLDGVLVKALQPEPAHRYQRAGEMKAALDRIRTSPLQRGPAAEAGSRSGARGNTAAYLAGICLPILAAAFFLWHRGKWEGFPFPAKPTVQSALKTAAPAPALPAPAGPMLREKSPKAGGQTSPAPDPPKHDPPAPEMPPPNVSQPPMQQNSLGMKFVLVPGANAYFSIWETRVRDYAEFARSTGAGVNDAWKSPKRDGMPVSSEPDDPVVMVSWAEARTFCKWLTQKEISAPERARGLHYRLPLDAEWCAALGVEKERGQTPRERQENGDLETFPWGADFPPKKKAGNFADETMKAKFPGMGKTMTGYADGFATTAPVGSFPANPLGIHDLSGNVWEWCADLFESGKEGRVLRGGSFTDGGRSYLCSSARTPWPPATRDSAGGFRCILTYVRDPGEPVARVAPAPATPVPSDPIVGRWRLDNKLIVFAPDGTFSTAASSETGLWTRKDGLQYQVFWSGDRWEYFFLNPGKDLSRRVRKGKGTETMLVPAGAPAP